jgi:hypothetical protein
MYSHFMMAKRSVPVCWRGSPGGQDSDRKTFERNAEPNAPRNSHPPHRLRMVQRTRRLDRLPTLPSRRLWVSLVVRRNCSFTMTYNPTDSWPFDQPRNCATLTMRQILDHTEPILVVSHDADDHAWQFIGSSDASLDDARVVALEEMVPLDPTILEVADLPPGWQATREQVGGPWTRQRCSPDPDEKI